VFPVLRALSSMIALSFKQPESSSSCNMFLLTQTNIADVSHDVNLARLLLFVVELFLAKTCLHACTDLSNCLFQVRSAFRSFQSVSDINYDISEHLYVLVLKI